MNATGEENQKNGSRFEEEGHYESKEVKYEGYMINRTLGQDSLGNDDKKVERAMLSVTDQLESTSQARKCRLPSSGSIHSNTGINPLTHDKPEQSSPTQESDSRSKLWLLTARNASTSAAMVEGVLLNPINEVAAYTGEHIISPTGEIVSKTGDLMLQATGDIITSTGESLSMSVVSERSRPRDNMQVHDEKFEQKMDSESQPAVDVRPRDDREEVELIARTESTYEQYESESHLLSDPIGYEDQAFSMNLKVIRGKDFPLDNARVRIVVLNENGTMDRTLGTTPWTRAKTHPIWGTAACSWSFIGNSSTQLLFLLEEEEANADKKDESRGTLRVCAKVFAGDLIYSAGNPNQWIHLFEHCPSSKIVAHFGSIQVRLILPTGASLHQQENCPKISPGPAFPPRMESYAIRKKAMYSCSPVILNVYDVSHDSRVETINDAVRAMGYGGVFHAAIQIHGKEYSYGGTLDRHSTVTGVFTCSPKKCPMHHYRESIYLGDCELNPQQVNGILEDLRPKWLARAYNLFRKNCAFFTRELAIELGVGDIPDWVFSLARTAEFIEPYAMKIKKYLGGTTKAPPISKRNAKLKLPTRDASSMEAAERIAVVLEEDGSMEAHHVAALTQESLLDHAMAARIQRSYRAAASARYIQISK
mmetsp:Transcript_26182/g.46152  ORF Transcript_26182/g.46152 Transcript_26182/m.46152 type:complete len:649 (-) Transcript_26182:1324-3270(-)